jgi:hypothetical protein
VFVRRRRLGAGLGSILLVLQFGCAGLQEIDLPGILDATAPRDQTTVARGSKEALEVSTQRTISTLSEPGGFSKNLGLRLALPSELATVAQVLKGVGLGAQVDALEDAMNLAAEQAASRAVPVFANAIKSISIADAFAILNGPDDAATVYFRERTSQELRARFSPIASNAMRQVGVYGVYQELIARYDQIPFAKPPSVDLEDYVATRTLDGIFGELAKNEALIREDPAARSTALLRRVFGATGA